MVKILQCHDIYTEDDDSSLDENYSDITRSNNVSENEYEYKYDFTRSDSENENYTSDKHCSDSESNRGKSDTELS